MELTLKEHKTQFGEETRVLDIYEIGKYTVKVFRCYDGEKLTWKTVSVVTRERYMPEIGYDDGYFNEAGKPQFTIQTAAYGAKSVEEIETIINGYKEAVEVVKILTEKFC